MKLLAQLLLGTMQPFSFGLYVVWSSQATTELPSFSAEKQRNVRHVNHLNDEYQFIAEYELYATELLQDIQLSTNTSSRQLTAPDLQEGEDSIQVPQGQGLGLQAGNCHGEDSIQVPQGQGLELQAGNKPG